MSNGDGTLEHPIDLCEDTEEVEMQSTEEEGEADDYFDETRHMTLRSKWMLDGCKTLDECIARYNEVIEYFKTLKDEGWELEDDINDDYGFLKRHLVVEEQREA